MNRQADCTSGPKKFTASSLGGLTGRLASYQCGGTVGLKATGDSKNDFCKFREESWKERAGSLDGRSRVSPPPVGRGR